MARDQTSAGKSHAADRRGREERRTLVLELDKFAWEALAEQSAELAVPVDELVTFSVLYYLADRDSQRIARRLPAELRSPPADA
jgi:hypothetical protein